MREVKSHIYIHHSGSWVPMEKDMRGSSWNNNLSSCLGIAGALCAAFSQGKRENEMHSLYHKYGYRREDCWWPGCKAESQEWVESQSFLISKFEK